jgi:hypothetical protein
MKKLTRYSMFDELKSSDGEKSKKGPDKRLKKQFKDFIMTLLKNKQRK